MNQTAQQTVARIVRRRRAAGFTLVELLVAILVLLVVIVATARIFGTASEVAGVGHATASVMQEAAALERRMRDDIARLSTEGYFAIRQVAVPNDINLATNGTLLDPTRREDAIIRADQLVFFASGVATPQTADFSGAINSFGQGTVSRIYYGHGVQLENGQAAISAGDNVMEAHDPGTIGNYPQLTSNFNYLMSGVHGFVPWRTGSLNMVRTDIGGGSDVGGPVYARQNANPYQSIDSRQPDANQWLLARQAVALIDDDRNATDSNSKTIYLGSAFGGAGGVRSARSIFIDHPNHGFAREIRNGRVDAAATRLDDIRDYIRWDPGGNLRPWNQPSYGGGVNADQRSIIASSIYYPRAERYAPSANRVDQSLTNHVIGSAVSSFIIEWTWDEGTGAQRNADGELIYNASHNQVGLDNFYHGFRANCYNEHSTVDDWCHSSDWPEHPWFGLNWPERGVGFMGFEDWPVNDNSNDNDSANDSNYFQRANFEPPIAVQLASGLNNDENHIERYFGPNDDAVFNPYGTDGSGIRIYEAIFGYNREHALERDVTTGELERTENYTPWPSAIRVTVIMHDPNGRLESGREYQFVINLPKRVK